MTSCFVLGNGPSLADVKNETLDTLPTFGSNRIFMKYTTPSYYCCINPTEANKYPKEIEELECIEKFVTNKVSIPGCTPLRSTVSVQFSVSPRWAVQEGYSVTFVLLQLAYFFGFRTVYLLGVDHRYIQPPAPNALITWRGEDVNHFDPNYVKDGDKWNCADLQKSEMFFAIARDVYEMNGRRIINCTEDSALDVFERGHID